MTLGFLGETASPLLTILTLKVFSDVWVLEQWKLHENIIKLAPKRAKLLKRIKKNCLAGTVGFLVYDLLERMKTDTQRQLRSRIFKMMDVQIRVSKTRLRDSCTVYDNELKGYSPKVLSSTKNQQTSRITQFRLTWVIDYRTDLGEIVR